MVYLLHVIAVGPVLTDDACRYRGFCIAIRQVSKNDLHGGRSLTATSALGYALSQTVFITKIFDGVESDGLTQEVSRSAILAAGATHLQQLSPNPQVVEKLQSAYMGGIKSVLILALVSACLAHLPLFGMEWLKFPVRDPVHADKHGDEERATGGVEQSAKDITA
jgi:hypothetical protein